MSRIPEAAKLPFGDGQRLGADGVARLAMSAAPIATDGPARVVSSCACGMSPGSGRVASADLVWELSRTTRASAGGCEL